MKKRLLHVIKKYIILLLIFIIYYLININTGIYIPCIFRKITGFKCPGCGITSMLFELLHFHIKEAFMFNPLVFIYLPFIIIYFLYLDYLYIYDKNDKILVKVPEYLKVLVLIITLLYGVVRNFIDI